MQKLNNPWNPLGNHCFACSPYNEIGLKLEFFLDDDTLIAYWQPEKKYEGYPNILHGGIQATLLDELGGWGVNVLLDTAGVTTAMNLQYLIPVNIDKGEITITSQLAEKSEKRAVFKCRIINSDGIICTEARVEYCIYPQAVARRKMKFPGRESFIK